MITWPGGCAAWDCAAVCGRWEPSTEARGQPGAAEAGTSPPALVLNKQQPKDQSVDFRYTDRRWSRDSPKAATFGLTRQTYSSSATASKTALHKKRDDMETRSVNLQCVFARFYQLLLFLPHYFLHARWDEMWLSHEKMEEECVQRLQRTENPALVSSSAGFISHQLHYDLEGFKKNLLPHS